MAERFMLPIQSRFKPTLPVSDLGLQIRDHPLYSNHLKPSLIPFRLDIFCNRYILFNQLYNATFNSKFINNDNDKQGKIQVYSIYE